MKNFLMIFSACLLFSSCSFYQINSKSDSGFLPGTSKKSFLDVEYVSEPAKPYREIGTLRVTTERNRGIEDVIRKMKMEAAIMGGDAITEVMPASEVPEEKKHNVVTPRLGYIGKVIVYQ